MTAFAPDGRLLWTFPNRWTGVHGSHNAPLPETGVMQGTLFFLGRAPLDEQSDVLVINGNHGRFFVVTSDGLYLDEMFKDVRMGTSIDATLIGGECFGGFFGRSAPDGRYYLQSGHTDYRIFRLDGLDQVRRTQGMFQVTPEQAVAAANNQTRAVATALRFARRSFRGSKSLPRSTAAARVGRAGRKSTGTARAGFPSPSASPTTRSVSICTTKWPIPRPGSIEVKTGRSCSRRAIRSTCNWQPIRRPIPSGPARRRATCGC